MLKKTASLSCLLLAAALLLWSLSGTYSEGWREGRLQKLARKGVLSRTWEGELALDGFRLRGDAGGNVWAFSVTDEAVRAELERLGVGSRVKVRYRERIVYDPLRQESGYDAQEALPGGRE